MEVETNAGSNSSLHNLGVQLWIQEVQIVATISDTKVTFTITILLEITNESNTLSRFQMRFRATSTEYTSTAVNQGNPHHGWVYLRIHHAFPMV